MHHLFYIENGTSLAIALQYIKEKQIAKNEILIFSGRNMKVECSYENIDISAFEFKASWFFPFGWIKTFNVKREISRVLKEKKIKTYKFYTSSISKLFCYFLMQNQKCEMVLNIEDGRGAFYLENEFRDYIKRFHYSDNKYRFYQFKCWLNYFFMHYPNPNKTVKILKENNNAIVSSNHSYTYVSERFIVKDLFKSSAKDYQNVKCLMSLSYPVEDGLIELTNYLEVLKETFEKLIGMGIDSIHYKFHPQQFNYPDNIKAYNKIILEYSNKINFVLLDNSVILEEVMANSNAMLLSDYSSIMIYTRGFGNEIVSNYNLIEKYRGLDKPLPRFPKVLEQIIKESYLK